MNQRENLNNLLRRSGYSYAPVEFKLCPALMKKFKEIYGAEASPETVFDFPWRYVNTPLLRRKITDWMPYYPDKKFNPGTEIDDFLVAHEPTPESMHMSRMYHPILFTALPDWLPLERKLPAPPKAAGTPVMVFIRKMNSAVFP